MFFALDARYTDKGARGAPALTGTDTVVLQPKHKEAEHADGKLRRDGRGGERRRRRRWPGPDRPRRGGDWAVYEPVNLTGIDALPFRVASAQAGGGIELRKDSPDGELLGTAAVPSDGRLRPLDRRTIDTPATTDSMGLYVVFKGTRTSAELLGGQRQGPLATTRPEVAITSPTERSRSSPARARSPRRDGRGERRSPRWSSSSTARASARTRRRRTAIEWTETDEDYYVVHAVATNDVGLTGDSRKVRFTVGDFGVKRAVGDVRQLDARGTSTQRSARRSRSAPPARTSGRARTSTAPCTCQGHARELRGDREGGVVRRHPPSVEGGHHGPQRDHRRRTRRPATWSSPRRATARRSSCTTPRQRPGQQRPASRWRPAAAPAASRTG